MNFHINKLVVFIFMLTGHRSLTFEVGSGLVAFRMLYTFVPGIRLIPFST